MLKDEHWLDILANKDIPKNISENDPDEVRETQVLREAILAEERLQQLTSRLQKDGYIKPHNSGWKKFFNWQTTYLVVVHASLIASITVIFMTYEPIIKDEPVPIPKSTMTTEQPSSVIKHFSKEELDYFIEEFTETGIEITITPQSGQLIVIKLPDIISADLHELLDDFGIKISDDSRTIELINILKQ